MTNVIVTTLVAIGTLFSLVAFWFAVSSSLHVSVTDWHDPQSRLHCIAAMASSVAMIGAGIFVALRKDRAHEQA